MRRLAPITLALCLLVSLPDSAATVTKKKTTTKKPTTTTATTKKKPTTTTTKKKPTTTTATTVSCAKTLKDCPPEGCGGDFDPNLNKQKNILPDDPRTNGEAEPHDVDWMKNLPDPKNFVKGGTRDELAGLGEGKKVRIFGYVLTIRAEGGETCNCKLTDVDDQVAVNTDNHLVVVNAATVKKFPLPNGANLDQWKAVLAKREPQSITSEFTPRVRLAHPNFTRAKVSPLILGVRQLALPVRLTGMLMFDSEHFIEHHLNRVNNWEVHPILKFEYCPSGQTCTADSDDGWKSLD
jgi:hypothetical protein